MQNFPQKYSIDLNVLLLDNYNLIHDLCKKHIVMPHLDHKGPEGKGAGTGRGLGRCKNKKKEEWPLGKGMGKRRKAEGEGDGDCEGKGKRLKSGKVFDEEK